ncbi:hypothetical protein B4098_1335 [Heyndrickxia coagulans]|uniref:Uncharacterized protein n=1 Tax=Heyndrickxia coagulans TaxID=1398 RepID=A0A150KCP2_HEYCO|nr:hypothetical protein B4098_1335 [Heyndrickxia coagulans]
MGKKGLLHQTSIFLISTERVDAQWDIMMIRTANGVEKKTGGAAEGSAIFFPG